MTRHRQAGPQTRDSRARLGHRDEVPKARVKWLLSDSNDPHSLAGPPGRLAAGTVRWVRLTRRRRWDIGNGLAGHGASVMPVMRRATA